MGRRWASLLGLIADKALSQGIKTAFNSLCMTFEGSFAPAMLTLLIADFDKEPTRQDAEILNGFNLWHF